MARVMCAALVAAVAFSLASPALARKKSSHFALELEGGASLPVDMAGAELPGYAGRVLFGAGGRPAGWWPVFYGQIAYARSGNCFGGEMFTVQRDTDSLLLGGRVVLPLGAGWRLFSELMLGPTWVTRAFDSAAPVAPEQASDVAFGYGIGLGLQYRFLYHLSVGLRAELADESGGGNAATALLVADPDGDPGMRTNLAAFVTAHF
jgi:hypothetical protein